MEEEKSNENSGTKNITKNKNSIEELCKDSDITEQILMSEWQVSKKYAG